MTIRRLLVVGGLVAGVTILTGAGWAIVATVGNEARQVGTSELRSLPPIGFVWSDRDRAQDTASGDVYVARADAKAARRVRAWPTLESLGDCLGSSGFCGPYGVYDANWSPDRDRIALELSVWTDDPSSQVAVVDSDGGRLRTVSEPSWSSQDTVWSSEGRVLVYSRYTDLLAYTPEGGRTRRIWRAGRPGGDADIHGVAASPDGRRLAVASRAGIVTITSQGADVITLTRGDDRDPRWSPDGRRIAFTRGTSIFVVGANGRGLRRLTKRVDAAGPLWSPDGRSLVFTGTRETPDTTASDVYVVGVDGRGLRRITSDVSSEPIDWSPDGSTILFLREAWDEDRPDKTWWELWIMDADGGRQTRLPFNRPRWSVLTADWN